MKPLQRILAGLFLSAALAGCQASASSGGDASQVDAESGADEAPDGAVGDAAGDVLMNDATASDAGTTLGDHASPAPCFKTLVSCGGQCVDPLYDPAHCGATKGCGEDGGSPGDICDAGCCAAGVCQPPDAAVCCAAGLVYCATGCVDPLSDTQYCGAKQDCALDGGYAGSPCQPLTQCLGGTCFVSCVGGDIACGGACIDPKRDNTHCGATNCDSDAGAGAVCAPGTLCIDGGCQ
jgi:hypothetical protein